MAVHLSRPQSRDINTLTVPAGVPLQFQLTSASVMNAFFIPELGSMIYTMNGMATRLNLRADATGTFQGLSAQFSGDGFADMHFTFTSYARAISKMGAGRSNAGKSLDERSYQQIAKPSMKNEPEIYRLADPDISHRSSHRNCRRRQDAGGREGCFAANGGRRCS